MWRVRVGAEPGQAYGAYLFQKLMQKTLPTAPHWSIMEVGCAPGGILVQFHRLFGYEPFGVEYSPVGFAQTQSLFKQHGLDPAHVLEPDFFDASFHERYRERFDVILSQGFIEHFEEPRKAVGLHVNLLRKGGYLVCSIPNLKSFSYPFLAVLGRDVLRSHNTKIMRLRPFTALFGGLGLEPVWYGYCGMFQLFGMSLRYERSFRGLVARGLDRLEGVIDHLMFLCLRGAAFECGWSSNLVFIGRRRG
jgi:SAM-dependent methyltransferase